MISVASHWCSLMLHSQYGIQLRVVTIHEQQVSILCESGAGGGCHSRTEPIRVVRFAPLPRRIARGAQVLRLLRLLRVLRVHVASPLGTPMS